jgi:hypothetical protein
MALIAQAALVADTPNLSVSELTTVAAALQKQIARDLKLYWDVEATIAPFVELEDVPPGYWPIIVREDINNDAAGIHCDENGQPLALVTFERDWSITASHEMLEMLVDPFGNRMIAGQSVKAGQGRVEYLVELADPTGDSWYWINDVKVSDFCTPRYFDPLTNPGTNYCYTGMIQSPRGLLPNGYLTWHDAASNEWWQQSRFSSGSPIIAALGTIVKTTCGLRSTVDRIAARQRRSSTQTHWVAANALEDDHESRRTGIIRAKQAKAEAWRKIIRQARHQKD